MNESTLPTLPCLCANVRRASRALTQMYDQSLRPLGLQTTQFTILQTLAQTGEILQGELGRILAMDSTTLTRTLEIMNRRGWITRRAGKDKRQRWLRLAMAGESQFKRATLRWEKVQARLRRRFGRKTWDNIFKLSNEVTRAVTEKGDLL